MLAAGPFQLRGLYVGIHFLALGALLALAGFNICNLGVFAKALMAERYSGLQSRTIAILRHRFSLEAGLLLGIAMIVAGASVDVIILIRWLGAPGKAMDSTVHAAFVATTITILGMNVLFSSFLISMILRRDHKL
jgi:hypothetical protein